MGAYEFACDEPPTVTCSAIVPDGDDDHDDGDLVIAFSAEAACGSVTVSAVIALVCEDGGLEVPVENGQVIDLECEDDAHECEVEAKDGVIEIEAGSAVLIVTAVDICGNTATCTLDLCAAGDDSEEDDDSPEG